MTSLLLCVKILKSGKLIDKLIFNENPEDENQIKYMGIIKIGKMSTSHIKLDDVLISRMHGMIENIDGKFFLTFMGKSETILNQKVLEQNEKIELLNEAKLKIGDFSLIFYLGLDFLDIDDDELKSISDNDIREIITESKNISTPIESLVNDKIKTIPVIDPKERDKSLYFNNNPEDEAMIKESIAKGIEIKHYWRGNLIDSKLFINKSDVATIGSSQEDTFFIDSKLLPNKKSFKILENMGEVYFPKDNVQYIEAREIYNLDELFESRKAIDQGNNGAIKLQFRTKIGFEIDENRIEVSHVPLYKTAGKSILAPILDGLNLRYTTLAALIHIVIIFVVYLIPPEIEAFNIEKLNKIPERYAKVILAPPKVKTVKVKVKFTKKVIKDNIKFDKNTKGDNYKFKSQNADSKISKRRLKTKEIIKNRGIFAYKSKMGSGHGIYAGMEDDEIKLTENTNITNGSSGVPGIRGGTSGPGGGGDSLGSSGPNTNGYRNTSPRNTIGGIKGPNKIKRAFIAKPGDDILFSGTFTRQQIQRVVNKGIAQIRYCYEKELLRSPKLKGNVTVLWKINPRGKVIYAKIHGATLKNNRVHQCMISRIKRWRFPEPKGGGYAEVRYPFNFRSN